MSSTFVWLDSITSAWLLPKYQCECSYTYIPQARLKMMNSPRTLFHQSANSTMLYMIHRMAGRLTLASDGWICHSIKLHLKVALLVFQVMCPKQTCEPYPLCIGLHNCQNYDKDVYCDMWMGSICETCPCCSSFGVCGLNFMFVICCVLSPHLGLPLYTAGTGCTV